MKIKSVLAALIATAAFSCVSVCAFADEADADPIETAVAVEAADPLENTGTNSGAEGVAAVAGITMVAGAALVISRKREQ